ncbi:MAG: right-handed parallel beta-helix repeat-containing protein, partial [Puniceicoccales bacterium]
QEENPFDVTLLVNPHDPKATDDGVGELAKPFRSIQAAASHAVKTAQQGQSVRVLIQPGVYRESVKLTGQANTEYALIKLEGAVPGEVILRGTTPIDGWSIEKENVFERAWNPADYPVDNTMLFVEVARMEEVNSLAKVKPGKVFFDRDSKKPKIYFLPPTGGTVKTGSIGIGRGEFALHASGLSELIVESLVIERGYIAGIALYDVPACVLNNLSAEYCQDIGIVAHGGEQLHLRRVLTDRCGQAGIRINGVGALSITGSEANLNGWRDLSGTMGIDIQNCGNVTGWSLRVVENHGRGMFLSGNTGQLKFTRLTVFNNQFEGLLATYNPGSIVIKGSEFAFNGDRGIVSRDSRMRLNGAIFYGNAKAQVWPLTGTELTAERCIMVATGAKDMLIGDGAAPYVGEQNLFFAKANPKPFTYENKPVDFAQWQESTRSDLNSYFGEPNLVDPDNYDFLPKPSSPFFKMSNWPVRELD